MRHTLGSVTVTFLIELALIYVFISSRAHRTLIWECQARCARAKTKRVRLIIRVHSLELVEADVRGLLSETASAEHEVVLSDETFRVGADAAGAGIFSVFTWV